MSAAPHTPDTPPAGTMPAGNPVRTPSGLAIMALAAGSALLAACATPAPAPAPSAPAPRPAPVAVEAVPYRPLPPGGAHYVMDVPARGPDGRRITVNSNLSDDQLVWNLRSAWNVAALNCNAPEYDPIVSGYRTFLTGNVKSLKAVNDRLEAKYAKQHRVRRDAIVARDAYTTQVYNFFAEPGARAGFCRAALDMANRLAVAPMADPLALARANFDGLLQPFEQFFSDYEAYQLASAAWDAKWGALYGPSQPGWVAVQQARAGQVQSDIVQTVTDPVTGQPVPVIPVNEGVTSLPVVQPIAPATGGKPGK